MLVLSRKADQHIVIADDIVVSILRITGNRVQIGIEAPETVRIVRGELELFVDDPPLGSVGDLVGESECHESVT